MARIILSRRLIYPLADKKASILIIALWSLCLLATFAVILGYNIRQKFVLVYRLDELSKLRFIAEAGVNKALTELKQAAPQLYDSLKDDLRNNTALFKEMEIGQGRADIAYEYSDGLSGISDTRYGLLDEESKLNINKIDTAVLERLFRSVLGCDEVEAQERAAAIIDWRDEDSELSLPIGSAEDAYYHSQKYPYQAKDADFETLEELLLLKGMTQGAFDKIKPYLTVYGGGKININTASGVVLLALGLDGKIVDDILAFRRGEDGTSGSYDDNVFESNSQILPKLSQTYALSDSELAELSRISEKYLVVNSGNFMINCIAKLRTAKNTLSIVCVSDKSGRILYWSEI